MTEERCPVSSLASSDFTKFPYHNNCIKWDLDLSSYCQIAIITETLKQIKSQRLPVPLRSDCKLPRMDRSQPLGQVYIIVGKEEKSGPEKKGTVVNKKLKKSD